MYDKTRKTGNSDTLVSGAFATNETNNCGGFPLLQKPTLERKEVQEIMGWSRSTLYNRLRQGFPRPISTGDRTRMWDTTKVIAYLRACNERGS